MKWVEFSSDIFITIPSNGHTTDEDSGEEDGVTINNLPGIQMTNESYAENGV